MNVDHLVENCYNAIPSDWRQRPWEHLNHGVAVLTSDDQLNAYIAAYGEMHIVKCRLALKNFPFEDLVNFRNDRGEIIRLKNFEVYDWGCGQGIASLVFMEMLHEREMLHGLKRVTLVGPSTAAINRAEHWVKQNAMPSTEIRVVNRFIPANDEPKWNDIECQTSIAIHICSNILDINTVGLKWLAQMTAGISGHNYYVCVGPQYGRGVSRITDFHNYLGSPACFTDFTRYPCGYTSRTRHPYGIEAKCFVVDSASRLNTCYIEQSEQTHVDEYQSGDECLEGSLPEPVIAAYHSLLSATCNGSFELYLRPSIGIERPDFVLLNMSRGAVIINVCDDISKFRIEFERVEAIKQAINETYVKSLKIGTILTPSVYNSIKTCLYFTSASNEEVEQAREDYYKNVIEEWRKAEDRRRRNFESRNKTYVPKSQPNDSTLYLVCLNKENCSEEIRSISSRGFRNDFFCEIKSLILGNWHKYSQGDRTLRLTNRQREFVENESPRLRIKGVAGCGKTQIVAHKAVKEHIRTGTKVLIVTFNIALIEYIKMRINQVPADFSTDVFEIINYHQFFMSKAKKYGGSHVPFGSPDKAKFFEPYRDKIKSNKDQYDTIIVDEAQDYITAWFDCLQYFLAENGRMILCGDGDQNLYGRDTEGVSRMPKVSGFENSPWRNINERVSMRMKNPALAKLASLFSREFNISNEPLAHQDEIAVEDYKLKYWSGDASVPTEIIAANIEWIIKEFSLDPKDVVILGQNIELLRDVDSSLRFDFLRKTMTTFESKEEYEKVKETTDSIGRLQQDLRAIRRVAKVHFTTDVNRLKIATIQSFKGWESKSVILIIKPNNVSSDTNSEDEYVHGALLNMPVHIYTAITRARENLFILNYGYERFHRFFKNAINND